MSSSITIGFSKPKSWKPFSWLIMIGYNIPYDHVYIKFHSNSYERDLIYQASGLTVNFMGIDIFNSKNKIVKEFNLPISDDNLKNMVQFAIDNVGKSYGILDCFGLAWVRICQLLGKTVKNPFNDNGSTYVCSELAAYILKQYENIEFKEDINSISPKDLYNYFINL